MLVARKFGTMLHIVKICLGALGGEAAIREDAGGSIGAGDEDEGTGGGEAATQGDAGGT